MEQKTKESTRYRGDDEPLRLDLILTREVHIKSDIRYKCPLGKSDHVILEMEIVNINKELKDESYKVNRLNYRKANKVKLKEYFGNINWENLMRTKDVQEKYDIFLKVNNEGVRK